MNRFLLVSIQGPKSVGKTTLINIIKTILRQQNNYSFCIGPKKRITSKSDLILTNRDDFIKNQHDYFLSEQIRWNSIQDSKCKTIILDRGPEDTICFSNIYPTYLQVGWDISDLIPGFTEKYIAKKSDIILYLDASTKELIKRQESKSFDFENPFSPRYYQLERGFFQSLDTVKFIDTDDIGPYEVAQICLNLVYRFWYFQKSH